MAAAEALALCDYPPLRRRRTPAELTGDSNLHHVGVGTPDGFWRQASSPDWRTQEAVCVGASFEVQGMWWLPEHPDHTVPGVLSWDPRHGGSLRLVGQLRPVVLLENVRPDGQVQKHRDRSSERDLTYPVVLGKSEHRAYTLLDAFQASKRDWSLEQSTETVHGNALLQGAWFTTPDLEVDRARFRLRDLAEWVDLNGLEVAYPAPDRTGSEFAVVTATSIPDLEIPLATAHVRLRHRLGAKPMGNESWTVEQDWVLSVDQDQIAPLSTFLDVASDLQDLVSIGTGRTAEFREVVLLHPDLPLLSLAGTPLGKARQDLVYHAQWSNRLDREVEGERADKPISTAQMFFTFKNLEADGVGRWLETAARFRSELGRAMATRYRRGYLEDRIMNVCAALESFDKHLRCIEKVGYVQRIRACVDLAGGELRDLIVEDADVWAERVRELRNDLAHHGDRFRLDGSVGGHIIYEQLFWLFAICMLRVARAPDAVFESIVRHAEWRWLRRQAQGG